MVRFRPLQHIGFVTSPHLRGEVRYLWHSMDNIQGQRQRHTLTRNCTSYRALDKAIPFGHVANEPENLTIASSILWNVQISNLDFGLKTNIGRSKNTRGPRIVIVHRFYHILICFASVGDEISRATSTPTLMHSWRFSSRKWRLHCFQAQAVQKIVATVVGGRCMGQI